MRKKKTGVSVGIQTDAHELLDILKGGGVYSVNDLADEMNRTKERIRRIVSRVRRRFNDGDERFDSWIFSTANGYSIEEKAEHAAFETRLRMRMGMGVIMNGVHPMKTMKRMLPKQFEQLSLEFKPRLITMNKVVK